MSDEYTPTTEQMLAAVARNYSQEQAESWLAAHDAEVAAKAWDEGRLAEELAWHHVFDGHPVPEGEVCDECAVANPYRKAVQSE